MRNFEHSVNVLVKAYLNETLAHGVCTACAVGNLIGDAIGRIPKREDNDWSGFNGFCWDNGSRTQWDFVFMTSGGIQEMNEHLYEGSAKKEIDATGYTLNELARIEFAFETCPRPDDLNIEGKYYVDNQWMFNGLMAVVDVLAEIHGIDLTAKEHAKTLFVKS